MKILIIFIVISQAYAAPGKYDQRAKNGQMSSSTSSLWNPIKARINAFKCITEFENDTFYDTRPAQKRFFQDICLREGGKDE